jgi:hypothetical protein
MREIPLTQGKVALIDDSDYELVSKYKWYVHHRGRCWYATRKIRIDGKLIQQHLHRLLLDAQPGEDVDHINGDGLDNQRNNIRLCTRSQNVANSGLRSTNTSGYKGVSWYSRYNKWMASIAINHKHITLGYFNNPQDAARVYDNAAQKYYSAFAKTNF